MFGNRTFCKLAGVEPHFEKLDGQDPVAYIFSANIGRRNLTKGQRAMLVARMYPEPERGRGKRDQARKETETVSFTRVKVARQVLRHSESLAGSVIKGTISLDQALEKTTLAEQLQKGSEAKMVMLRQKAPDLLTGWGPPLLARLG
jgi:hypothetical protein